MRLRRRMYPPYCGCGWWGWHHAYGPYGPPSWYTEAPTLEEEKEDLKEHIEVLREELKAAEKRLEEMEKSA